MAPSRAVNACPNPTKSPHASHQGDICWGCRAEASAAEQAQVVRDLKESKGLGNSSPEVQAAVDELLERKAVVERLK